MFTIGREREKNNAKRYVRDPADYPAIDQVIDAVHDCLDGREDADVVRQAFRFAFHAGGAGTWEQTGSWLRKLCVERPEFSDLWEDLADSSKATLRFRSAACLPDMPAQVAVKILERLSRDPSKKIRLKIAGDLWVEPREGTKSILAEWLIREPDDEVRAEIQMALEKLR